MNKESTKLANTALIYLSALLQACSVGWFIFLIAYKLHIYAGFPRPGLDGLSFVMMILLLGFIHKTKNSIKESNLSIQEQFSSSMIKLFLGVLTLTLVLNFDWLVATIRSFINAFIFTSFK